jgi:hypothetical protein
MSESKTVKVVFPDASFIRPGTPVDPDIVQPKQSSIRDTYFATLYRLWMKDGAFGFDSNVHEDFRKALAEYITKTVAIKMVTEDASTSAQAVGLQLSLNKAEIEAFASATLDVQLFANICDVIGLTEFRNEIILREIDKTFGTARQLASEKRILKKKEDEHDHWLRNTGSGIHNMLRELTVLMKKSASQTRTPEPVRPEIIRALHQTIDERMDDTEA